MKKLLLLFACTFLFLQASLAQTHVNGYYRKDGTYVHSYTRSSSSSSNSTSTSHTSTGTTHYYSTTTGTVQRDSHGHIKRSSAAKYAFEKQTGYPHGRPGYVVDHVIPLASGGCDCPENMQWQTTAEAKEKDKWERK